MANPIVEEIMKAPRDQEIVFDAYESPDRYLNMRKFMFDAGSDMLLIASPRVVISKHISLCEPDEDENNGRHLIGQAFERYFYQESKAN